MPVTAGFSRKRLLGAAFTAMLALCIAPPTAAQTSSAGAVVDVEIYNPATGKNTFCVAPGESFTARIWVQPGTDTLTCTPACGSVVGGGAANLASAVIDVAFDPASLSFDQAATNPDPEFAAVDGLIQDNSTKGRVGWVLAGDWTPDASPSSGTLATPCQMGLLDEAGWVFEVRFTALPSAAGTGVIRLRRETDDPPFALSFADICGSDALTETGGGIDEVQDAIIYFSDTCDTTIFRDGFETTSTNQWSSAVPS